MGCSASRQTFDNAGIESAKPTPIKALPGSAVLKASNTYLLKNKVFRLREDCMPHPSNH